MPSRNGSEQEHSEHIFGFVQSEAGDGDMYWNVGHGKERECGKKGKVLLSCAFCHSVVNVCKLVLLSQQFCFGNSIVTVNEKQHSQMCCWVSYRS